MQRLIALLFLGLACLAVPPAAAQQPSPFQRPGPAVPAEPAEPPGIYQQIMLEVRRIQSELYRELASAVGALKGEYSFSAGWALIAVSLLYGVFHAVGPGHGKAVISAYLLANERAVKQGILLAFLSSLAQALSAIVLVLGGAWAFDLVGQRLLDRAWNLEQASFAVIALIGLYLLWQAATGRGGHHHHQHHYPGVALHDHGHGHGHHDTHLPLPTAGEKLTVRRALPIVAAVGLRPCGGALIVLVFALANSLYWAGIGATLAMSLGTAVTVSLLAVLTLTSKRFALRLAARDLRWPGRLEIGLRVLGALALIAFGGLFLLASIDQPRSPFGL